MKSFVFLFAILATSQMSYGSLRMPEVYDVLGGSAGLGFQNYVPFPIRQVRSQSVVSDAANVFGNLASGAVGSAQNAFAGGAGAVQSAAQGFQNLAGEFLGQNRAVRNPQFQDFANVFGNLATGAVASSQAAMAGGAAAVGSAAQGFQNLAGIFGFGQNHPSAGGAVNQPIGSNPQPVGGAVNQPSVANSQSVGPVPAV